MASHLQRAGAVGLHDLGLQVGTGTQVASVEVEASDTGWLGLGDGLLLALLGLVRVLLQASHFLPFSHLQHLVFRRAHLVSK